jgi:hypothetical protein
MGTTGGAGWAASSAICFFAAAILPAVTERRNDFFHLPEDAQRIPKKTGRRLLDVLADLIAAEFEGPHRRRAHD